MPVKGGGRVAYPSKTENVVSIPEGMSLTTTGCVEVFLCCLGNTKTNVNISEVLVGCIIYGKIIQTKVVKQRLS